MEVTAWFITKTINGSGSLYYYDYTLSSKIIILKIILTQVTCQSTLSSENWFMAISCAPVYSPLDADINHSFFVVQDLRKIRLCRIFNFTIEVPISRHWSKIQNFRWNYFTGVFMKLLGLMIRMAVFMLETLKSSRRI